MRINLRVLLTAAMVAVDAARAGPPFRTDDPEPVEYQHWEIYGFAAATQVQGERSGVLPGVEVNYGAVPDLQLHIIAPLAFDKPSGNDTRHGYGDTEVGIKYRFVHEDQGGWRPQVGTFPLIELPTGNADRNLGTGHTRLFVPVWVQKSIADWTTYGGGGYWINHGADNRNYWFFGWLLQRKINDKLAVGGEIFHQTADKIGGAESTGFNFGGTYDFTEHYHLLFSGGRGIQSARTTNEFSYYLAGQ